jgi:hypothetical protein
MSDRDAPTLDPVVAKLKDPDVRAGLVRLALQPTGSPADADDLVADAIECAIKPG